MLEGWILSAVAAGGSALAGAAATDAWQSARAGIARLFGRAGQRRADLAEVWADETAAEIAAAPVRQQVEVRQRLALVWQQRLADLVQEYPDLDDELRGWAGELRQRLPAAQRHWVNTFVATDNATQYNAPGGSITVTGHLWERPSS
ncbi:hypothetical protein V6V47_26175 [Micromonospora sp. CPCC 205539]|uniref:hypothetical protein n=1 Tax=Micromonospora sp. CPCC 205539 TaxID=3122408 RepID=UPI002FF2681F